MALQIKSHILALPYKLKTADRRSLGMGLGAIIAFYACLFSYFSLFSDSTLKNLEKELASQVIPLHQGAAPQTTAENEHARAQTEHHTPDPHTQPETGEHTETKHVPPTALEGLYEKTSDNRELPIIRGSDGLTGFKAYKVPFDFAKATKPLVAFVITDFGLSRATSETALGTLPAEVSLSLSPYADMAGEWIKIARQSGREVWLDVPFENEEDTPSDNGMLTLLSHATFMSNQDHLHDILSQAQEYPGISGRTDELISEQEAQFKKIMEEVYGRGLGFIELNPRAPREIFNMALGLNAPYIKADLEIKPDADTDPFKQIETIAQLKGYAVAVVPNYPENIKRLSAWILKKTPADYTLAPISAIYELPLQKKEKAEETPPDITHIPEESETAAPHGLESTDHAPPPAPPAHEDHHE